MASDAPVSPLRHLLDDVENLFTESIRRERDEHLQQLKESVQRGRNELAEQLNQAIRRLRQDEDAEALAATLVDAAAAFAEGAALFRIEDGVAHGQRIRGVAEEQADRFLSVAVPLADASAFAGAEESRDPVIAVTSPSQISQTLV